MKKEENEIIQMKEGEGHYCTYVPTILVDEEGYLYEGGSCYVCGEQVTRNYDLKLKQSTKHS